MVDLVVEVDDSVVAGLAVRLDLVVAGLVTGLALVVAGLVVAFALGVSLRTVAGLPRGRRRVVDTLESDESESLESVVESDSLESESLESVVESDSLESLVVVSESLELSERR